MKYEWKPQENHDFEGVIELNIPKYTQRLKYIKQCNFKAKKNEKGELEVDAGLDSLDSIVEMVEIAKQHVEKVNVRHKESQAVFKSWDELEENPVCDGLLSEIGSMVVNGPVLGKQQSEA